MKLFTRGGRADPAAQAVPAERQGMLASLLALAWVVEARDPYTGGHLWRVARYAALLGERAGWTAALCARAAIGGFLHDLGKIGIPDAILRKPAALSDTEYEVIRTHPEVGARLLAGHPLADLALDAVLMHHERPDGTGYPARLAGEQVPPMARVVGICDAFDAITSTRPYRAGLPVGAALEQIARGGGAQFDASLAQQFIALGSDGLLDHIAGHSDDGIPLQLCLNCGPTLVVRREQVAGQAVFCRNCGGQYRLEDGPLRDGAHPLRTVAAGGTGSAADLEPAADMALIKRFVQDTAGQALA